MTTSKSGFADGRRRRGRSESSSSSDEEGKEEAAISDKTKDLYSSKDDLDERNTSTLHSISSPPAKKGFFFK